MQTPSRVRPPKQARSQQTLERLLVAAETLLAERPWEQIGVAELCAAADASVGAFYARFTDKDALLDLLADAYRTDMARFAEQLGAAVRAAIEMAATIRLRPVLMTTAAMVVGVFPLLVASGAGAASRFNIGLVVTSGMLIGTLFTLFVVPTMYTLFAARHTPDATPPG